MDEEFKKDEILIEQRKLNTPKDLRNIAVQQDNNSEVIYFIVPRYINENDLSNNSFLLKTLSRGGRNDVLFSSKDIEVLKDTIKIKWVIDEFSTSYCGELQIQLTVFNENFKWQTEIAKVNILKTIDDANLATSKVGLIEDLILQFNEKVEVIENNTEEIKEIKNEIYETIEDTERLLENATDIKNEVERIKEEAEHYASFSQQSADLAQKIKDSTEIFYDVDKELNRVGFKRANEKTFTYTGNLKGVKGDKGEEIELQKTPTHIQWKYKDSESWTNLIAIDDLKGEDGVGEKGNGWLLGEGIPVNSVGMDGDFYIQTSTYDIFNKEEGVWISIGNIKGEQGLAGIDGTNGREVELQKTSTHIQWKYVDTEDWKNLIEISMLKGERGETGLQGEQGVAGRDGVDGTNGREVELQKGETHIEWKYTDEGEWRELVELSSLKGDKGEAVSVTAQMIPPQTDLYTLTYGEYYTQDNASARTCKSIPYSSINSFNLQVIQTTQTDTTKYLILTTYAPNEIWTNNYNFGSWGGWKKIGGETSQDAVKPHTHEIRDVNGLQGQIDDLKLSVSSGKNGIASAITAKGVSSSGSDSFATLANNISKISTSNISAKYPANTSSKPPASPFASYRALTGYGSVPMRISHVLFSVCGEDGKLTSDSTRDQTLNISADKEFYILSTPKEEFTLDKTDYYKVPTKAKVTRRFLISRNLVKSESVVIFNPLKTEISIKPTIAEDNVRTVICAVL